MNWRNILLRKDWLHNRARNILSALSILLGVAVIIATAITVSSSKIAFLQMVDAQNSGADLLAVSASEEQIGTAAFSSRDTAIRDAFPFLSEDCFFENSGTYHSLTEMAVDFSRESEYGGLKLTNGSLPKSGECLVSDTMKTTFALNLGDTINLRTGTGSQALVISGFVQNSGIATANLGKCVLTDYRNMPGEANITFKLMLKPGTDVKAEKAALEKASSGKYTLSYPGGESEQMLKEVNLLFETMMGFGFLTLLLGGFLVNVTINEYVRKMRPKVAVLKVLGADKGDIFRLVLKKSLVIGIAGTLCGGAIGVGGAFGLIRLVGRSFCGGMDIQPVIRWSILISVIVGALLFCLLVSLPAASRAAKENIADGFRELSTTSGVSASKIILSGVLSAVMIAARLLTGQWLFTFAAIAACIYFTASIALVPCARLVLKPIALLSPFNGFTVKNNIIKQRRKAINLAVLFAFVIAISVGITLVVNGISDSINRMEKGEFFGDAIVSTVTGQGLGKDVLAKVRSADGVAKAYPVYQKYVNIGDDSVQIKGMGLDETNEARLTEYWMIEKSSLKKLKAHDTILLSQIVMRDLKLNVGDSITLGSGTDAVTLKIVGTYNTMNNDGKSAILSEESFLKTFRDYSIRSVNVFMKNGTNFNTLKASIEGQVNDSYIQVDGSSDAQETSAKQSNQFIKLIDCMIVVLVAASVLMLVNSISMNIKNNQYSLSITKLLGATNRNLMIQSLIEGIIYGVFSVIIGVSAGSLLSFVLTSSMNKLTAFNLKATLPAPLLILCGFGFLLVALLAEVISTGLNYKTDYKAVMVQD